MIPIKLTSLTVLLILFGYSVLGQAPDASSLDRKVGTYVISPRSAGLVLGNLASKEQVPIGIEWAANRESLRKRESASLTIANGTVRDVLNAVVTVMPEYRWYEESGVITIRPLADQDPLLEVLIHHFS